jgi:hypothetical protein
MIQCQIVSYRLGIVRTRLPPPTRPGSPTSTSEENTVAILYPLSLLGCTDRLVVKI